MHVPRATYRLQLTPDFKFSDAESLVPYLADLGISDIYLSPIFKATMGSTHGYDVVDPTLVNDELGGRVGLESLCKAADAAGLNRLADIVPNHMAFESDNVMLMDVLENGEGSRYVHYFDIRWDHFYESLRGRLLAPFLGKFYGEALEAGEISLKYNESGLSINYYELRFPVRIESYVTVFTHKIERLEETLGAHHPALLKFIGTVHTLNDLPGPHRINERYEQIRFTKKLLRGLYTGNEAIRVFIDETLTEFNGVPGDDDSYSLLNELLLEQHFRLSFWKVATEEINYRRFFTINNLISVRLEDRAVFDETHALVKELCDKGIVQGLRIDHIDGLNDPDEYLHRLRKIAPDAYVVVEKILEHGERLPADWSVAGTTGYESLNAINSVLADNEHEAKFSRLYNRFARLQFSWETLVANMKRLMVDKHLAGNIDNLAHFLKRISARDRYGYDITLYGLRRALVEVMAYFPVYRTYINRNHFSDQDRAVIDHAVKKARDHNPDLTYELEFIHKFLHLRHQEMATESQRKQAIDFVMRFQQVTGPLMAKGVEDTCLYIYCRLLSLNEVGGSPNRFGVSVDEFHQFNIKQSGRHSSAMVTTATHDTKRGEDARARLNVLSEMPDEWDFMIRTWRKLNKKRKTVAGAKVPDKNDEYFFYQALLAHWPIQEEERDAFPNRLKEYIIKAIREAKVHTAWLKPDNSYENAHLYFIDAALKEDAFLVSFSPFCRKVTWFGLLNSLSQLTLKLTCPGVPDFYQGNELWDFSMVDPDNRRPVDFSLRTNRLAAIRKRLKNDRDGLLADAMNSMYEGDIKLFVTHTGLVARSAHEELFRDGDYIPCEVQGPRANNLVAYARRHRDHWAMVVVPRLMTSLISENQFPVGENVWDQTEIQLPEEAPPKWRNIFTNEQLTVNENIRAGQILNRFPVAILINEETS